MARSRQSSGIGIPAALDHVRATIDRLGWFDDGERNYFDQHRGRYEFTLDRMSTLVRPGADVLDVGSHLLHFSMAAAKLRYAVRGADIAYFADLGLNKN